ncbi:MAG: FxsA family protein, partial [Gammaproteobacteria bacterium]
MLRIWPILFIVVPLVELYLIIKVGSMIGALWTVLLVLLTAVIGVSLLRIQGFSTLNRARQNMEMGVMPAMEMMEGLALAVGGALLITPGFITDTLGFLCLIPATR